jgi:Malectin domain
MLRCKISIWQTLLLLLPVAGSAATTQNHYFGHKTVQDKFGVIAPWYKGQNGQFDFRVRVAAETMKRYPWVTKNQAAMAAPAYVYDGTWKINRQGKITVVPEKDWANGDLGQRAAYILRGMIDYYRYSGDPAAFAIISATANYLVDHCETSAGHGWPNMLISVPTMGVRYGNCRLGPSDVLKEGEGKIQLDIVAEVGLQLVRAYEMIGNVRWYEAAKHWADLLVENRRREPEASPWGRYANNADGKGMNGVQTGGVAYILEFFDELIRTGYRGADDDLIAARDAGRKYLRDILLPAWTLNDTWGRNFWDWEDPVQSLFPTDPDATYLMDHQKFFPNWRDEARNILSQYLNHTSVSPKSDGDTYSGAWAYPESSGCCGRSLSYSPMTLASTFAQYAVEANSEWANEIARRSQLLATYDGLPNGQAMDNIDGGSLVDGTWFKIAHPMALLYVLRTMGWLPKITGANRENHIMRSTAVVRRVFYGKGVIRYSTHDAPVHTVDVLRLAFIPTSVTADSKELPRRSDLMADGFMVQELGNGDCVVTLRHDGATEVILKGPDPQAMVDDKQLAFEGHWQVAGGPQDLHESLHVTSQGGASVSYAFVGNQVRLVGAVSKTGGRAEVYVDGIKEVVPIDFYSPVPLHQQILYYLNGLSNSKHTLKVVVEGKHNPLSGGDEAFVDGVQYSNATGTSGWGEGGGPTGTQRMIFGYTKPTNYVDSQGARWRPGTEFIARTGNLTDSVAKTWNIMRQAVFIEGTPDPELYRYGVSWPDFTVNVTVGPDTYHVRLRFAETQCDAPNQRGISISINGEKVASNFDILATAGGADKAVDLVYNGVRPENGVIAIRFVGSQIGGCQRDAMVQAVEVGPGDGGTGARPRSIVVPGTARNLRSDNYMRVQAAR